MLADYYYNVFDLFFWFIHFKQNIFFSRTDESTPGSSSNDDAGDSDIEMIEDNGGGDSSSKAFPAKRVTTRADRQKAGAEDVPQLIAGLDDAKREAMAKTRRKKLFSFKLL